MGLPCATNSREHLQQDWFAEGSYSILFPEAWSRALHALAATFRLGPSIVDLNVLSFDPVKTVKGFAKDLGVDGRLGPTWNEGSDPLDTSLLPGRTKWPCRHRATQHNERPPVHSMISLARTRIDGGTV